MVLEKTLESLLDCKEIKPFHPKGNQSWIFIGRTDAWSWISNTLATWWEELTHLKRPWCWDRLKAGGEGDDIGRDGLMVSLTQQTWVWVNPGVGDGQWGLACCSLWACKELDMTEWLNWTELKQNIRVLFNFSIYSFVITLFSIKLWEQVFFNNNQTLIVILLLFFRGLTWVIYSKPVPKQTCGTW